MRLKALVGLSLLCGVTWTASAATIIHAGRLINGRDDVAHTEMSLVIDNGRVVRVEPGYVAPQADAPQDKLASWNARGWRTDAPATCRESPSV